jgi:hypothetical protein
VISKLKIIKWIKLLIILIVIVASGFAQTIDPIELVLEINPEIKAAELSYQSALEKVKVAGILPDPMIEGLDPLKTKLCLGKNFLFGVN